MYHT